MGLWELDYFTINELLFVARCLSPAEAVRVQRGCCGSEAAVAVIEFLLRIFKLGLCWLAVVRESCVIREAKLLRSDTLSVF